ncbi:unnamed protein product [Oncorhynchus mykiss]|uniref:Uncharacterized protein n=1 Tax=Oncorhynchus mykiss TaxID=8022 RepID=A0A060Z3H8_ONCMY|nr:unnamed protein product [Oncorhynchus mykiss]
MSLKHKTHPFLQHRDGITASKPEGTGWSNVPMCMQMKHVTYDLGRLWVVSKSGFTMVCTH